MITFTPITELFKIGSFSVQAWGSFVAFGAALAIILILIEAKRRKITEETEKLLLFITIFSIIGARIAYILLNPDEFSSLLSYLNIFNGGLIGWGVLMGGILGIFAFKFTSRINPSKLLSLLDLMMPYFALAFAIGRIGCFVRGCCFGIPTDLAWGILYTGKSLAYQAGFATAVHPTQLYHSIADFIIFLILLKLSRKRHNIEKNKLKSKYPFFNISGNIFLLFIALYSAERFFIDFFRYHPANEYVLGITITQIVYLVLFIAGLLLTKRREEKQG